MDAALVLMFVGVVAILVLLAWAMRAPHPELEESIGLSVSAVKGIGHVMANVERPPLNLTDAEGATLSIAAKDLGGAKLPADRFQWSSSDETIVSLGSLAPDGAGGTTDVGPYARFASTPAPGTATVTVLNTATGNTETMQVNVGFSADGEIGLSAGTPVPEAPPAS